MAIVRFALALGYVTCILLTVSAQNQYQAPSLPAEPQEPVDRVRRDQGKDSDIEAIFGRNDEGNKENIRKERSYYYRVETPASIISIWRPPVYRLHRPYFIPVYGAEGAIPIYFPPQPLYIHQGYPLDNPPYPPSKPSQGYLPSEGQDPGDIGNRFGDENDRPIWGRYPTRPDQSTRPDQPTRTDQPTRPDQQFQPTRPVRPPQPTRRPSSSATTSFPPLVHNEPVTETSNQLSNREGGASVQSTTPKPSQCVWAIVNCCAAESANVNNRCFERFGCPGPFWDSSPCDSNFARVAIQSALNYYGDQ